MVRTLSHSEDWRRGGISEILVREVWRSVISDVVEVVVAWAEGVEMVARVVVRIVVRADLLEEDS